MHNFWLELFARIVNVNLFSLVALGSFWLVRRSGLRLAPRLKLVLWWVLALRLLGDLLGAPVDLTAPDMNAQPRMLTIGVGSGPGWSPRLFNFDVSLGGRSVSLGEYAITRCGPGAAGHGAQVLLALGLLIFLHRLGRAFLFHRALQRQAGAQTPAGYRVLQPHPSLPDLFVWGGWNPTIYISSQAQERLAREHLTAAALSHEAAHCRRRDHLVFLALSLCEGLLWFVPALAVAARGIRAETELLCDQAALASGTEPKALARALLCVCQVLTLGSAQACLGGDNSYRMLQRRLGAIFSPARVTHTRALATLLGLIWIFGLHFFTK